METLRQHLKNLGSLPALLQIKARKEFTAKVRNRDFAKHENVIANRNLFTTRSRHGELKHPSLDWKWMDWLQTFTNTNPKPTSQKDPLYGWIMLQKSEQKN
mmetsp:Transcript_26957/g.30122  ORF Transcript_26957/g.30122 Transcript_26957/m.30122 type:complete len:101 (-) Transcript_26957:316-618(-)